MGAKALGHVQSFSTASFHSDVPSTHPVSSEYVFRRGDPVPKRKDYSSKPVDPKRPGETEYV